MLLVSPTTVTPALNALKVHSGAQLQTNASLSVDKTQHTVPVLAHVSAIQDLDFCQDHAKPAPQTTSSPMDIA